MLRNISKKNVKGVLEKISKLIIFNKIKSYCFHGWIDIGLPTKYVIFYFKKTWKKCIWFKKLIYDHKLIKSNMLSWGGVGRFLKNKN